MVEFNISGHGWQQNGIRRVDDFGLCVKRFEDAVDCGGCPLQLDVEVNDADGGVIKVAEVGVKSEKLTGFDFTPNHFASVPQNGAGPDSTYQAAGNLEIAVEVALVHRNDEAFLLGCPKALDFPRFHRECFHDRDAINLLREPTNHRFPLLAEGDADFPDVFEEELVAEHVDGEDTDGGDGKPPLDCEQPRGDDEKGCDVGDEQDKPGCQCVLDNIDVGCQPRHNLARLLAIVVCEGQALEMTVGLEPEIKDDALSKPRDEIVQQVRDDGAEGIESDDAKEDPPQHFEVPIGDGDIQDLFLEQGHRDCGQRHRKHQEDGDDNAYAVRVEIAEQALELTHRETA